MDTLPSKEKLPDWLRRWYALKGEPRFREAADEIERLQRQVDALRRERDMSATVAGRALTELHEKVTSLEPESEQQSYTEPDGCPTEMAVLKRFWREHQAAEVRPTAWMRGHRSYSPGEPDDYDVECVYGDDPPDDSGKWIPLYRRPSQPPCDDLKEATRLLHVVNAWFWRASDDPDSARVDPLYPARGTSCSKAPLFAAIRALLDRYPYGGATSTKEVKP